MNKFFEKFQTVFAAVSFAEAGEWDEAIKTADSSLKPQAADGVQVQERKKVQQRKVDNRPQLRL